MGITIDGWKCIGCMACEMACGYHRDEGFAFLSSCIVLYRSREKVDYFGVLLKSAEDELVIARPDKSEVKKVGAAGQESSSQDQGDSAAKPMLLREACDLCQEMQYGPLCIKFCPVNAISLD